MELGQTDRLDNQAKQPASKDDVENRQFSVPAVQSDEGADRQQRGWDVDDAGVENLDGHRRDQTDDRAGDPEQEGAKPVVLRHGEEEAVKEDREDEGWK